ncbi:hypothetical protein NHQ30_002330 [Ciborinia camelliae]|nr:hypothetical protein NHQ30_002330 [Ciborinia camelliae]
MDGLSSASSAFAVISLTVQLAQSVKKLVEFWKAVEDAPGDVNELFNDLELLSAVLVKNHNKFAQHSPYDLIAKRIFSKFAFTSPSSRKRKWAALKITLKNDEIKKMRNSVGESFVAVQMIQQDAISDMVEMALRPQEESSKGISAIQEFLVQYSQNLRPMDRVKSLPSTYDSSRLLAAVDTTTLRVPNSHEDKKSPGYPRSTSTMIDTMGLQKSSSVLSGEVTSAANSFQQQIITHTSSRTTSWETDGQTSISSFRISSASRKIRRTYEHGSQEAVNTRIGIVFYPAKWLYRLGVSVGIRMSATVDNGWMFTFSSFGAVPEDALIFDLCRQGNVAGVKMLLDRGDASLECENPQGKTPLSTASYHGQVDVARFLIASGAKDTTNLDEIRKSTAVLDARLKIAMIKNLQVYDKDKNSIWGSVGRLAIFYRPNIRINDMPLEEISDNMLCVFKALTPSLRTGDLA